MTSTPETQTTPCRLCGTTEALVAAAIGCCADCLRRHPSRALALVRAVRREVERSTPSAVAPAVRRQRSDRLVAMGFYDDHPANCIASWQCPGTTGCGYPRYAVSSGCETGCRNLAVFTAGCNFTCPFCQDWIHRTMAQTGLPAFTDDEILTWVDERTTCVCFCGGTPDVQMAAVLRLARGYAERYRGRVLRLCAETNLTAPWRLLEPFARLCHESGGGLNIGLKAGSDTIHRALTGRSNAPVWRNLERLHALFGVGDEVPFLRPSLLLVPGYVDEEEVRLVARRLAGMDQRFSLKLIAFLPRYRMSEAPASRSDDLTRLSRVARNEGLERVSPGVEADSKLRFAR